MALGSLAGAEGRRPPGCLGPYGRRRGWEPLLLLGLRSAAAVGPARCTTPPPQPPPGPGSPPPAGSLGACPAPPPTAANQRARLMNSERAGTAPPPPPAAPPARADPERGRGRRWRPPCTWSTISTVSAPRGPRARRPRGAPSAAAPRAPGTSCRPRGLGRVAGAAGCDLGRADGAGQGRKRGEGAGGGREGSRRLGRANSRCVTAGRGRVGRGLRTRPAHSLGPAPTQAPLRLRPRPRPFLAPPVPSGLQVELTPAAGLRVLGAPGFGPPPGCAPASCVTAVGEGLRATGRLSPALGTAAWRRGGRRRVGPGGRAVLCPGGSRSAPPAAERWCFPSLYRPGKAQRCPADCSGSPARRGAEPTRDP